MLVSDAWPAPATYHGRFVNTVTRGWVGALTSAPRSDFMALSLVLSIDVCRGLVISPLRMNITLCFSQADLGPRSAQELSLSECVKSLKLSFSKICAHSERYRNLLAGSLNFDFFFFWQHRVSIVTGLRHPFTART